MGRSREREYNLGDENLPNLTDREVIARIIEWRWRKNQKKENLSLDLTGEEKSQPALEFNPALVTLFEADDLWITVNGVRFTPDAVVKSLIVRSDGEPINWHKRDSPFIDSRKRKLESKFGVRLLSVWNKQKEQYWEEPFIRWFFASIQEANLHPPVHWNHTAYTAYTIRETARIDELRVIGNKAQAVLLKVARNRWNPYLITKR